MSHYCHYHPLNPAKWYCDRCAIHYCNRCMPDANELATRGLCPQCRLNMKYLGAVNEIEPFWNRIPSFFTYPLQSAPLIVISIVTLVPLIIGSHFWALIIAFMLLCVLIKYTYTVLNNTSQGHMKPPSVNDAFSGGGYAVAFQQVIVLILMLMLVKGAEQAGGSVLGFIVSAFLVLALPASIIILAMEEKITDAINPLRLLSMVLSIGWSYIILYGYLVLLLFAQSVAIEFIFNHFPRIAIYPSSGFIYSYFMLVIFNMLGYLVFQFQDKLGYAADIQDDGAITTPLNNPLQRLDADIDIGLKEGRYDEVVGILTEQINKHVAQPCRVEQLYRLLSALGDWETLIQYTQPVARHLVRENQPARAATLMKQVWTQSPDYKMQDLELIHRLCLLFYQAGEYKLVLRFGNNLHHRFEHNPQVADCYLLVAKTLANGLQQWGKAASYIGFIKKNFPDHPIQQHMDDFEAALATHRRLELH